MASFINDLFPDVVHAVDLENSIRYALTIEIPTQQLLDESKMKAIYQYLEIIIRYLPLRENIIKFLKALREWPIQMDLRTMKSTDFLDKVTELMSIHRPFDATPKEYIGCKGSQPHFRGKPRHIREISCLLKIQNRVTFSILSTFIYVPKQTTECVTDSD